MPILDVLKNFRLFKSDKDTGQIAKRGFAKLRDYSFGSELDMSQFKLDYDVLFKAYRTNADVFGCVREWEENIGSAGWALQVPNDPEAEPQDYVVADIYTILNYDRPWRETKNRIVRDMGVTANAFLLILQNYRNEVIGLQPLDPRTITLVTDKYGTILKYIQKSRTGAELVEFQPEQIIHFKYGSNPDHEVLGFSPLETVIWEARTDLQAMIANYGFFENSAMPSVLYMLEDGMSEEDQNAAMQMIKKQFKGAKNRHKGGVLNGVKDIKTLNISQKDMEFLAGRKFHTEKICSAYGVPKFFLGITDEVNNNNAVELRKGAFEGTFKPIEDLIAETMTLQLLNRMGLEGMVEFVFKPQMFEQQEQLEERALKMLQAGAITLRQFKKMVGQEITAEDESRPNFDEYVIHQGAGAILLEDAGAQSLFNEPVNANQTE